MQIKQKLQKIYKSIAFIPTLVVLFFLLLSAAMIYLDYSDLGKSLKSATDWIRLKDPSTARTLVSVIAGGLISLTVFSFSMVMVVLNQAASQLSNRVLENLIGNRLQQFILGFYIGTIIYSLLLLTSVRDVESGIYVPALSTYLLIVLSVSAIFLFVFFLHFITQSIKYSVIIHRIYNQTLASMKHACTLTEEPYVTSPPQGLPLYTNRSGILQTFDRQTLLHIAEKNDCVITMLYPQGHFLLAGVAIANVHCGAAKLTKDLQAQIMAQLVFDDQPVIENYFQAGFRQLSEIAIKALSPGINDPGTATESLHALAQLLAYRLAHAPENNVKDAAGQVRIITKELSFDEIFNEALLPVWDYGKNDRNILQQFHIILTQLQCLSQSVAVRKLLALVQQQQHRHNEQE